MSRLTSGGKAVIKHDLFKGDLSPCRASHPAAKPSSNTTFSRETCHRAAPHIRRQSRHQTRPFQGRLVTVSRLTSGGKAVIKHDLFKGDLSPCRASHPAAKPSSNTTFSRETWHRSRASHPAAKPSSNTTFSRETWHRSRASIRRQSRNGIQSKTRDR